MTPVDFSLVLLSALLHAVWSVAIKGSARPVAFNALQAFAGLPLALGALALVPVGELPTRFWWIFAASSLAHSLYFYWMARSYEHGDLTLVYPIARSTPAFLPFIAVPLLGEHVAPIAALGIAAVVAGIWLVQIDRGIRWRALLERGTVYAYLTLAATVGYSLTDKSAMVLLDTVDWPSLLPRAVFYFFMTEAGSAALFGSAAWLSLPRGSIAATWRSEWRKVLLALAISLASYTLILQALRSAQASYVVTVRQSSVLFAVALGMLMLGERPGPRRIAGAVLTVAGVALVGLAK